SDRGYPPQSRIEDFYVICSKINQKDEAGCDWIGVPPRSGLVQQLLDGRTGPYIKNSEARIIFITN
ncbi:MAG: hypothetical protein WAT12_06355, partial [Candidatus Nitrotoga sp.]